MPEGAANPANQLVLAFDFGVKRIGVAVGQAFLGTAKPIATLKFEANAQRFAAIEKLIAEWHPDLLVVGLPSNTTTQTAATPEDNEHNMHARCRRFANQLYGRFKLPVALVDESFSSVVAEEELASKGMKWQERRAVLDAEAARLILESYFAGTPYEIYPPHGLPVSTPRPPANN